MSERNRIAFEAEHGVTVDEYVRAMNSVRFVHPRLGPKGMAMMADPSEAGPHTGKKDESESTLAAQENHDTIPPPRQPAESSHESVGHVGRKDSRFEDQSRPVRKAMCAMVKMVNESEGERRFGQPKGGA